MKEGETSKVNIYYELYFSLFVFLRFISTHTHLPFSSHLLHLYRNKEETSPESILISQCILLTSPLQLLSLHFPAYLYLSTRTSLSVTIMNSLEETEEASQDNIFSSQCFFLISYLFFPSLHFYEYLYLSTRTYLSFSNYHEHLLRNGRDIMREHIDLTVYLSHLASQQLPSLHLSAYSHRST